MKGTQSMFLEYHRLSGNYPIIPASHPSRKNKDAARVGYPNFDDSKEYYRTVQE